MEEGRSVGGAAERLMTFEVEINDRVRTVTLEPVEDQPGRFRVSIEGTSRLVDAARVDASTLSLLLLDERNETRDVGVRPTGAPGELELHTPAGMVLAVINGRRALRRGAGGSSAGGPGEQRILAPMPGRVVRVLVAAGDAVVARQPVVIVEAMKMENELRSSKPGRVREVLVSEGMAVEAGRPLVIVE
jgi:biotin carboxyl carrier protein